MPKRKVLENENGSSITENIILGSKQRQSKINALVGIFSENENNSPTMQTSTRDLKQRQSKLSAIALMSNRTMHPNIYAKRLRKSNIDYSDSTEKTSTSTSIITTDDTIDKSKIDRLQVSVQLEDIGAKKPPKIENRQVYVKLEDIGCNTSFDKINKKLITGTTSGVKIESVAIGDGKATGRKRVAIKKEVAPVVPIGNETKSSKVKKRENSSPGPLDKKSKAKSVAGQIEIPVDQECTSLVGRVHVFCEGSAVYGVMLNQTNLQQNNNKFYLIQLLEHKQETEYFVWMRWARVGKIGQNKLVSFGDDLESAKDCFIQKFFDKTRNCWEDRADFRKVHGKYDLVYIDYSKKPLEDRIENTDEPETRLEVIESKLDQKIQDLIRIFFDIREMNSAVSEMKYDTNKVPLGRLSESQIKAGYSALRQIEGLISEGYDGRKKLIQACNDYYTRVPHDFGMRHPPMICSIQEIKTELELLETLSDIKIAMSLLNKGGASDIHTLDKNYINLKCEITPITSKNPVYKILKNYLEWTHGATHSSYGLELLDLFSVRKDQEWSNYEDCGNRMLLWHGSRTTNYAGILSQGLRIAPREAPVTGHMFGKGVYFTDTSSKSANYVYPSRSKNEGFLLLCEVTLGTCNELVKTDERAHRLPPGCNSVKGLGVMSPDRATWATMADGVVVPAGVLVDTGLAKKHKGYVLNYNEYIVYRTNQIKMRYLLKVRFNYKK